MTRVRTVVLDNEAVQALHDVRNRKHRRALAVIEAVLARRARPRSAAARLVVPTAVRVEAGWDRRAAGAAIVNRLRVDDAPLEGTAADRAAEVRTELGVSVADAHLAVVLATVEGPVAVLTSDVDDLYRITGHLQRPATIVTL